MGRIYTVITPDGPEIVLGVFDSEKSAEASYRRKFAADWRSLACGPLEQRAPNTGEDVHCGRRWTECDPVNGECNVCPMVHCNRIANEVRKT